MNTIKVKEALNRFFLEDIGERDVTSQLIFPDNLLSKGTFLAKDTGVFAGRLVIEEGFKLIDERIKVELHKKRWRSCRKRRNNCNCPRTNRIVINGRARYIKRYPAYEWDSDNDIRDCSCLR